MIQNRKIYEAFRRTPTQTAAEATRQTGAIDRGVNLWKMFCWENLGPGIHVEVTLTRTTYLSIVADLFMEMVFPGGCGLFQQEEGGVRFLTAVGFPQCH